MWYFFDYLTGGNIKVAASSIAGLHFFVNCDYMQAYVIRMNSLLKQAIRKNNNKTFATFELVASNLILNYVDMAVLDLSINAAPKFVPYHETYDSFHDEIAGYLQKKNVKSQFIFGDNSDMTREYANSVRRSMYQNII